MHREQIVKRERKPTRCNNQMFIINFCLNMFRTSLCPSSGEQDMCYCTWCAALVLLDVVGSGCGALHCRVWVLWTVTFTVLAPYNTAPHNHYQPHPAEPAQHTTCSSTRLVLLKMGIMMPETCWENVDNKRLTVASCWFSLSLYNSLFNRWHNTLFQKTEFAATPQWRSRIL